MLAISILGMVLTQIFPDHNNRQVWFILSDVWLVGAIIVYKIERHGIK